MSYTFNPFTGNFDYYEKSSSGGTTGYNLQDQDRDASYAYVGYKKTSGDWYIYRRTRATNARQYATGASSYTTNWTGRNGLIYV